MSAFTPELITRSASADVKGPSQNLKVQFLDTETLVESLHASLSGLDSREAERRLVEFGPNEIESAKRRSLLLQFVGELTHFFALILWIGAGIAFFAEWKSPGGGMNLLGCAMIGVILINAVFSFWQQYQAEQAINALRKLIPHTAKAFRNGMLNELPASQVVPGDIVSLEEGDDVPADCRLVECIGMRVNNSTLTGESAPVSRDLAPSQTAQLIHSTNVVLAGTSIYSGHGRALAFATGMRTEFGKIAQMTQSAPESLSPLQKRSSASVA